MSGFPTRGTVLDRRQLLAAAAGALLSRPLLAAEPKPVRRLYQMNGYPVDAETPLEELTDYRTPNDVFFVRHHWNPTFPDAKEWRLALDGEVASPLSLSLAELRKMPRTSVTCVLQCAGNGRGLFSPAVPGVQWKYGAVGCARWTGVKVKDLLSRAKVRQGARHLLTFGADTPPGKVPPFHRSLEVEKAFEDAVVAFEMNGEPLGKLHGAPARLVVPGWAGDHWMKWLTRLTVSKEPQKGFYMETAYRYPKKPGPPGEPVKPEEMAPVTELFVKSNFTSAPARARVGETVTVRGFAFSGAPDVSKVEITDDGGATFHAATLEKEHEPHAWRRFTFAWKAKGPGTATLAVRATDVRGSVQPKDGVWNPSGYLWNGWHTAAIEVTA
ncbi:MAG TPA: sulfite oxidase [Thermoanaerobaculia bacterium]|jgi:DMSO/TMAO reductase YedYZ molybdopterin-dependent catalytic subunit|nr:sulfite oxidase [Thermoanaerobaculia bacterium]